MNSIKNIIIAGSVLLLFSCTDSDTGIGDTGTGGSMARFTIKGNYLYAVDYNNLNTFDISDSTNIIEKKEQQLGFGIETIFPYGENLFIGAVNGMHIYDISTPDFPVKKSFTPHFVSYDPVVVQGDFAYVTLRTGDNGWGWANLLQIYDISQLNEPNLLAEYEMTGPKGLGILNDRLFICDADELKVFSVSNGYQIEQLQSFALSAIDVIPHPDRLYVIADDGFYQYNYQETGLEFLSKITMTPYEGK